MFRVHDVAPNREALDVAAAVKEIKAGKVKWVIPETPVSPVEMAGDLLNKAIGHEN
jgi:hypothetical protein